MLTKCFCYLLLVCALAVPGHSATIIPNQWYSGLWNPSNQTLTNDFAYTGTLGTEVADPGPAPWTFTNSSHWMLVVMDLGRDGDSFDVFDNGVGIGSTSIPTDDRTQCGDDPLGCTDPRWSQGTFNLNPGSHSITLVIKTFASDSDRGNNAFMVMPGVDPVPEPGTVWLFGCGILLLVVYPHWGRISTRISLRSNPHGSVFKFNQDGGTR